MPPPPAPVARPVTVRAADAEHLPSIGHHLLADSSATAGALSAHRVTLGPGGAGAAPHRHTRSSELFFVVDGALDVLVGDDVVTGRAGDLVLVPPGCTHAFGAAAHDGADALVVITPGVERFDYFHHVVRQRAGEQDPAVLDALQEHFDTYVVDSAAWRGARAS